MAINTLDQYVAAAKQVISYVRNSFRTTLANNRFSTLDLTGNPGAGVLAGTSTTTGVVPTDATAGCPIINAFGGSAKGYLTRVAFGCTVACRLFIGDLLWKAGAYAFNASTTGQTPTSFSSRVPGGTDYSGLEIWIEQVTAGTGIQSVAITYTNQAGTTGRTGGVRADPAATIGSIGRMWQYALQAGDTGVQAITGVVGSVATGGTFNILVIRPLWTSRVPAANFGDTHSFDVTGMPEVYTDSALFVMIAADSTSSGTPELLIEIANA